MAALTIKGLYNMQAAYYFNYNSYYKSFRKILKEEIDFSSLTRFDKIPYEVVIKHSSFFYILLLEKEILDAINNNYKTNFMIEIDQKSSFSVFLSIILGNTMLAKESNLLGGNGKDPINLLMSKSKKFFVQYNDKISNENLFIISSRKLNKFLFFYVLLL